MRFTLYYALFWIFVWICAASTQNGGVQIYALTLCVSAQFMRRVEALERTSSGLIIKEQP